MATIKGGEKVEAYLQSIAKKLSGKKTLRVGFLEKSTYPGGKQVALIAAIQDFGAPRAGIPPRPFMRNAIAMNQSGWTPVIKRALKNTNYDLEASLKVLGEVIRGQIQQSIHDTSSPPLKPATIKRKGFSTPLIDTGHMINSVDYDIKS